MRGLKELRVDLKDAQNMKAIKLVVKKNGSALAREVKKNMKDQYTGHWAWEKGVGKIWKDPQGHLEGSIADKYTVDGLTAHVGSFSPNVKYFGYLEYGTRYMHPRPTLRPAFIKQTATFLSDLKKVMK